jgi:hypothetical protein
MNKRLRLPTSRHRTRSRKEKAVDAILHVELAVLYFPFRQMTPKFGQWT